MPIKCNCDRRTNCYCYIFDDNVMHYQGQQQPGACVRKQKMATTKISKRLHVLTSSGAGLLDENKNRYEQQVNVCDITLYRPRLKLRSNGCSRVKYLVTASSVVQEKCDENTVFECTLGTNTLNCSNPASSNDFALLSPPCYSVSSIEICKNSNNNESVMIMDSTNAACGAFSLSACEESSSCQIYAVDSKPYKDSANLKGQCCKRPAYNSTNQNHILNNINYNKLPLVYTWQFAMFLRKPQQFLSMLMIVMLCLARATCSHGLLVMDPVFLGLSDVHAQSNTHSDSSSLLNSSYNSTRIGTKPGLTASTAGSSTSLTASSGSYLDKLDNLERSVAAVLIKVAYGTTSTTKRSIPDNSYVPSLTTIATPPLTTLRYLEKSPHQQQINLHHRNYELDLERDHALPTSAPNADILKSNSNPTYPNPNRHHNHDRERHRHVLNSTPSPSLSNILIKNNAGQPPTIPVYSGDMPSYSPPARSFFTPPLPPEYQNPFADKPTLRGTNNDGGIANTGTYINRRPIPPPSLMPGHERIPFRPPDLTSASGGVPMLTTGAAIPQISYSPSSALNPLQTNGADADRIIALNTPSRSNGLQAVGHVNSVFYNNTNQYAQETTTQNGGGAVSSDDQALSGAQNTRQEVLPSIRRILSGSNGNKGEIPEVLLKQVTSRPVINYHQPPSSPVVLIDSTSQESKEDNGNGLAANSNINKSKNKESTDAEEEKVNNDKSSNNANGSEMNRKMSKSTAYPNSQKHSGISSTPAAATAIGEVAAATSTTTTSATDAKSVFPSSSAPTGSSSTSSATAAAAAAHTTWTVAWNIHVYLSVVLFTILGVYSFYKMLTFNKLTHLFSQSYFICIHLILITICLARIFYLCYDAYNIHSTFHTFVSEILLNLPATFLTISFSVLILFLFLKSLNHKNNRYSALIRPLTVVVGCGVHVVLCITLHYVESYTMQNHQQHLYYQQQFYRRQQAQQQQYHFAATPSNILTPLGAAAAMHNSGASVGGASATAAIATPPPRVLSLICQIIYIFICLSLGLLYLYIYRILKRILRSKSQNYIHGFQNLSYAIHITIATALLFVLLAALQIFGAISISLTRPLITVTTEMDWLQWGYQFSLRLIEIAIITLMSWVAGLKTSGGGADAVVSVDARGVPVSGAANNAGVFGAPIDASGIREKHGGGHHNHHHHHNHHSNMAGFFLPCTSSSSQEQFETDYPAVCNANTNLHTYTMRTGKLIYDDSLALNSLGGGATLAATRNADFQQPAYQQPYDTGSMHSSVIQNSVVDYAAEGNVHGGAGGIIHYHHAQQQYTDYLTDATTDHYENPNFELRGNTHSAANGLHKLTAQTSATSTSASCSGGSGSCTSAASQQQMLLLQSDSCYSEPLQQLYNSANSYEFNNLERPKFCGAAHHGVRSEQHASTTRNRDKKSCNQLERAAYEQAERRSSNSTHSGSSGGGRYASYNSFELSNANNIVRKSGTLNNIACGGGVMHGRTAAGSAAVQRASGVQTLASAERQQHHHQQQQIQLQQLTQRGGALNIKRVTNRDRDHDARLSDYDFECRRASLQQHNSDDDMMLAASNAERTNLISNVDDSCISNQPAEAGRKPHFSFNHPQAHFPQKTDNGHDSVASSSASNSASAETSTASAASATSGSMLVAEHGFVRFRALEDMNKAQGLGIHNAFGRNRAAPPTFVNNTIGTAEQVPEVLANNS